MKSDLVMSGPSDQAPISPSPSDHRHCRNVAGLIAQRQVSPRAKHVTRRRWGETSKRKAGSSSGPKCEATRDAKRGLLSWIEAASLRHFSARYCHLVPPPRSTIAAAFSPDGRTLASTHGDHTVKIIDCQTGSCIKVLSGHRRTPWVVRFHPLHPEIIASGSLDHEVRLWNLHTSECVGSRDFYRPIASIAFHAKGEFLAVASGHKLYIWNFKDESSSPEVVLKTWRSLRAVHFHPHGVPFLLTAEVNDLDSSDSSMTRATSPGYLQYPSPAVFVANVPSSEHLRLAAELPLMSSPFVFVTSFLDDPRIEMERENGPDGSNNIQDTSSVSVQFQADANAAEQHASTVSLMETFPSVPNISHPNAEESVDNSFLNGTGSGVFNRTENAMDTDEMQNASGSLLGSFKNLDSANPGSTSLSWVSGRSGLQHYYPHFRISVPESGDSAASLNMLHDGNDAHPVMSRVQSEIATSLAAATELPCTVKLRVWSHDIKNLCAPLTSNRCRLTIPHAVLCSEMGAHFSPCGRFLAACVACILPHTEADPGLHSQVHQDSESATSPTRHPISAHQVMYELRIYSLEEATFGSVLVSRAITAAHCLTSIQFSPTSEHILLAYGRRHGSLLKSIVIDGETTVPVYTVLEVYRVSDMELVRVLPSADDEVNVACFHPFAGGGLVYGTKEGRLRVLQFDGARSGTCVGPNYFRDENMAVVV